jgi:hypothetical protein
MLVVMNVLYARMFWALQDKLRPEMDGRKLGTKYYVLDTGAVSTM